jgi:hypothetical protein
VGAVEVVLDVESSEVFWDPSRAGFPRVLVQRRSNRHGRFIIIFFFFWISKIVYTKTQKGAHHNYTGGTPLKKNDVHHSIT